MSAIYRRLSKEELQPLEKEFVEFLVLNGITANDWEKMKAEDVAKAERFVELFSDVVFESILRKLSFLEHRVQKSVKAFQCLPDKLVVVTMKVADHEPADFTNASYLAEAARNPPATLKVSYADKGYSTSREKELFEMMQMGCSIADGTLFKTLSGMLGE